MMMQLIFFLVLFKKTEKNLGVGFYGTNMRDWGLKDEDIIVGLILDDLDFNKIKIRLWNLNDGESMVIEEWYSQLCSWMSGVEE